MAAHKNKPHKKGRRRPKAEPFEDELRKRKKGKQILSRKRAKRTGKATRKHPPHPPRGVSAKRKKKGKLKRHTPHKPTRKEKRVPPRGKGKRPGRPRKPAKSRRIAKKRAIKRRRRRAPALREFFVSLTYSKKNRTRSLDFYVIAPDASAVMPMILDAIDEGSDSKGFDLDWAQQIPWRESDVDEIRGHESRIRSKRRARVEVH